MKTRIIICVSNRPDLLEKQIQLLNNFMIGEKVVSIVYDTEINSMKVSSRKYVMNII